MKSKDCKTDPVDATLDELIGMMDAQIAKTARGAKKPAQNPPQGEHEG